MCRKCTQSFSVTDSRFQQQTNKTVKKITQNCKLLVHTLLILIKLWSCSSVRWILMPQKGKWHPIKQCNWLFQNPKVHNERDFCWFNFILNNLHIVLGVFFTCQGDLKMLFLSSSWKTVNEYLHIVLLVWKESNFGLGLERRF